MDWLTEFIFFWFWELGNFPSWGFENWEIVMKKWEIPSKTAENVLENVRIQYRKIIDEMCISQK